MGLGFHVDAIGTFHWYQPGAAHNGWYGFCSVLIIAAFAYSGSEVVGLIPLEALLLAAEYYIWRDKLERPKTETEAIQIAHDKMNLSAFNAFDPKTKIIEYAIYN